MTLKITEADNEKAGKASGVEGAVVSRESVMQAIQSGTSVPAALAATTSNEGVVTNVTWTSSPSGDSGGSDSGEGDGFSEAYY